MITINNLSFYTIILIVTSFTLSAQDMVAVSVQLLNETKEFKIANDQAKNLMTIIDGIYVQQKTAIIFLLANAECTGHDDQYSMTYHIDQLDQKRNIRITSLSKTKSIVESVDYSNGFKYHIFPSTKFKNLAIKCSQLTTFAHIIAHITK